MSSDLNARQLEVAMSRARRTMAHAGAGTGKTAASVGWVCGLLQDGVAPEKILMLTFTRKAALEMTARAVARAGGHAKKITGGTYHAVASQLIRADSSGFGISHSKISLLDDNDARDLWKSAARVCGIHGAEPAPSTLAAFVSSLRNRDQNVKMVLQKEFSENAVSMFDAYEAIKRKGGLLDYDDLLLLWRQRLSTDPSYREELRNRFKYILVDEMQDNNVLQYDIVSHLNPEHLLVVGDINQSIYGFRAAQPALMVRFRQENPDANVVQLDINYRSAQAILDVANYVIKDSESPITLKSCSSRSGVVRHICFSTAAAEAQSVFEDIRSLRTSGTPLSDIAVLARGSRALLLLEMELRKGRIAYRKYGGQSISDAAEVKDFVSFLRLVHNIKDRPALIRAATLFSGVGEIGAERAADANDILAALPGQSKQVGEWVRYMAGLELPCALEFLQKQMLPLFKRNYPDNYAERMATISNLVREFSEPGVSLTDVLDAFITERFDSEHPENTLTLSTIHSAKGLEWTRVYLIGCGSMQIPHPRAMTRDELSEEKRLLYVAVTRAKSHLTISFPSIYNKSTQKACGFLPDTTKWLSV